MVRSGRRVETTTLTAVKRGEITSVIKEPDEPEVMMKGSANFDAVEANRKEELGNSVKRGSKDISFLNSKNM